MVEDLGRSTSTRFLTKTDPGAAGVRFGWMLASNARWTWPGVQSRPRRSPQDYRDSPQGSRDQIRDQDATGQRRTVRVG